MSDCSTCGKTREWIARHQFVWECSHVECPMRRATMHAPPDLRPRDENDRESTAAPDELVKRLPSA